MVWASVEWDAVGWGGVGFWGGWGRRVDTKEREGGKGEGEEEEGGVEYVCGSKGGREGGCCFLFPCGI